MAVAAVEHTETAQLGLYRTRRTGGPADRRTGRRGTRGRRGGALRRMPAARGTLRVPRPARAGRPGTLCFQCFRSELGRRQDVAERRRRGWNAVQAGLPLAETIEALHTRRRRAQIAARHALDGTTPAPRLPRPRAS